MATLDSKRRRRRRRRTVWLLVIIIAAALAVLLVMKLSDRGTTLEEKEKEEQTSESTYTTATLSVVGDISIDDALMDDALQPDGSYDFLKYFLEAAPYLYEADLTIGNLEMNFAGKPYGTAYYSAPDELAETLQLLGFDVMQTSNSKSITSGISGMESTIKTLKAYGITPVGTFVSKADAAENNVVIKEVNGIRIAFIAFTKGFDGMTLPAGREYCANVLYKDYDDMYEEVNTDAIKAVVARAKAASPDLIIAMVHWGSAYKLAVSDSQRTIANLLLNNGVDVILGSHSHIVGPMRYVTVTTGNDERQAFVAYSLGNFMSSDTAAYTRDTVVLNLTIRKNENSGYTTVSDASFVPLYIYDHGEESNDRYRIIDIYQSLQRYKTTFYLKVSDNGYSRIMAALDDLASNTESAFCIPNPYQKEEAEEGEE